MVKLTEHQRRILAYLDQKGGEQHRTAMVSDLASPESRIGQGVVNGSNAFIPAIAAKWCRPLEEKGLVIETRDRMGYHRSYGITTKGREAIR